MKRIIIYCMLLAAVLLIPVDRMDISNLEPIQAVWMYEKDGMICLKTDTDDAGSGETVQEALEEMKSKSEGIVYLDTAEFLLVTNDVQNQIPKISTYLKNDVKVSEWAGEGAITDAAKYMKAHKIGIKLSDWDSNVKLPTIPIITNSGSGKKT